MKVVSTGGSRFKRGSALLLAAAFAGASAFGANGGNLIGISPVATAMGGTGTGTFMTEMDAMDKNVGFLGDHPLAPNGGKWSAELAVTMFKNNPTATATVLNPGTGQVGTNTAASGGGVMPLPNAALSYKWTDDLTVGFSYASFGGATSDYTGNKSPGIQELKSRAYFGRATIDGSYRILDSASWGRLTVGAGPILTYGTFQLNSDAASSTTQTNQASDGETGFGGQVGLAWHTPVKNLSAGLSYRSKTTLNFNNVVDYPAFTGGAAGSDKFGPLKLQTPQEIGFGLAYNLTDDLKVTFDYRFIGWSSASGFSDLGWQDQNVFAVGGQYEVSKTLAVRAGVNYAKSPIRSTSNEANTAPNSFQGQANLYPYVLSDFNLTAFPGITEWTVTAGAGYQVTDTFGLDIAGALAPANTITRGGTMAFAQGAAYSFSDSNTQWSISVGGTLKF